MDDGIFCRCLWQKAKRQCDVDYKTFMNIDLYKIAMKEMLIDNMKCMLELMTSAIV
jgi:hypothetical protein